MSLFEMQFFAFQKVLLALYALGTLGNGNDKMLLLESAYQSIILSDGKGIRN